MNCLLWQDWLTLRATTLATLTSFTQSEDAWLDMTPYQDLTVWFQVTEITNPSAGGSVYIDVQTSPVRDEAYFLSMIGSGTTGVAFTTGSATPVTKKLIKDLAATPLSRWLRWQVNLGGVASTSNWDITFRLFLAANFKMGAGAPMPRSAVPGRGPMPPGQTPFTGGGRQPGPGAGTRGINPAAFFYPSKPGGTSLT
jgi:hypothetical protein